MMIAAGACIGSGIFITPSDVAGQLGNGIEVLIVWLIGGVVALTGALSFGELASRFPGTGGVYVYLREAYGDLWAFLYGWCSLTVITSGAIAGLCLVFSRYLCVVLHLDFSYQIPIAITELAVVTIINVFGVKFSSLFASGLTVLKITGIALIVVVAFLFGDELSANISIQSQNTSYVSFGIALIGVLWSYGGWHHASYVGGEVVNAQKVLPKALFFGALIVTITYMLVNVGLLSLLPYQEIVSSKAIAADALSKVTAVGAIFIAVLIAISTFGTASIYALSTPRIYFMMGADKVFFPWLADIHPTYKTPAKAILFQTAWAVVLLLFWGTFENLSTYVVFMDWIFMTMGCVALFLFRKRLGKDSLGYKTPLYPLMPLIFIAISTWFLISTLIGRPVQTIAGLILMVLGLPVYYYFKRKQKRNSI